jgi:hypothetical protein
MVTPTGIFDVVFRYLGRSELDQGDSTLKQQRQSLQPTAWACIGLTHNDMIVYRRDMRIYDTKEKNEAHKSSQTRCIWCSHQILHPVEHVQSATVIDNVAEDKSFGPVAFYRMASLFPRRLSMWANRHSILLQCQTLPRYPDHHRLNVLAHHGNHEIEELWEVC